MPAPHRRRFAIIGTLALVIALVAPTPIWQWPHGTEAGVDAATSHPHISASKAHPHASTSHGLLASNKPDWRVDYGNTGRVSVNGPATAPGQVYQAQPGNLSVLGGVDLDGSGNVIFNDIAGSVYSYAPGGAQNWAVTGLSATGGDAQCPASVPALSTDGTIYLGDDTGNLRQINLVGLAAGATPPVKSIFRDPLGSAGLRGIPKIGPDNTIYVGDGGGVLYALNPGTPGSTATKIYGFGAFGSTQTAGLYNGVQSSAPFKFCGEVAIDPGSGTVYVASTDSNPSANNAQNLGTLYAVVADSTTRSGARALWSMPLEGAVSGSVVLDGSTIIVADSAPEVAAFDTSGNQLWSVHPTGAQPFRSSPALSPDGKTVYVADLGGKVFALNVQDGSPVSSFGNAGVVTLDSGAISSPIVDASGRIYIESNTGELYCLAPNGQVPGGGAGPLWTIAPGTDPGNTGSSAPKWMSPAIAANGTIYVSGNSGLVRGFAVSSGPTGTPTITPTPSTTGSPTQTGTNTNTPSTTPTSSATGTPTPTATATQTGTPTSTNIPGAPTGTTTPTGTATATGTATPTGTTTATTTPTTTPTTTTTATGTPSATATGTPSATATGNSSATASRTSTAAATQTATGTPNGPASGWSSIRGDAHNDGLLPIQLNLSNPPGSAWHTNLAQNGHLYATGALAPDGTIYWPDGAGKLVALHTDGSIKWRSAAVLGPPASLVLPGAVPHLGSSPAVAVDGTIYEGSEIGGIYKFSPSDGSNTKIFSSGQFQGSSVIIGPDGTLYAGDVNGTVYAVNPATNASHSYHIGQNQECPAGYSVFIDSTPVLDGKGNLYIGFGCNAASAGQLTGGILSLDSGMKYRWSQSYTSKTTQVNQGATFGPVMLSPDEQTVYSVDAGRGISNLLALDTSNGNVKWTKDLSTVNGSILTTPALSPDGKLIYLETSGATPPENPALIALNTTDGSVAKALAAQPNGAPASVGGLVRPIVDNSGNLLVLYNDGGEAGFSAGLGGSLFTPENVLLGGATSFFSGMVGDALTSKGTIYVGDNVGTLYALRAGVVQPSPTPFPTQPPAPTPPPPPTLTPVPSIPTDTPTSTPVGGAPTGTSTPTPQGGSSHTGLATSSGATSGLGGGSGSGSTTPGSKTGSGNAQVQQKQVSGKGFVLDYVPGTLAVNNFSRFTVHAKPGAHISYTLDVVFQTASTVASASTPSKKPTTGKTSTKSVVPSAAMGAQAAASRSLSAAGRPIGTSAVSEASAAVPAGLEGYRVPSLQLHTRAAAACPVAATIRARGTIRFSRTANAQGVDQFCLQVAAMPANAVAIQAKLSIQVTAGSSKYQASTVSFLVAKVLKISASALVGTLFPGAMQTIKALTDSGATLTYQITYTSAGKPAVTLTGKVDAKGANQAKFKVQYTPSRTDGLVSATVTISGVAYGVVKGHTVLHFTVLRKDAVLALKKLTATVRTPVVHTGAAVSIDTISARYAYLSYTITYGTQVATVTYGKRRVTVQYGIVADGSGYATLKFPVTYKAPKGKRVASFISITVQQGKKTIKAKAAFTVQG